VTLQAAAKAPILKLSNNLAKSTSGPWHWERQESDPAWSQGARPRIEGLVFESAAPGEVVATIPIGDNRSDRF
jgi:hypothetical protein